MPTRPRPSSRPPWPVALLAAVLTIAGCAVLLQRDQARQRDAFETQARIAHRLLSQQAVQHEAMLATLALLQGQHGASGDAEQRLPAIFPSVLRVSRREPGQAWPTPPGDADPHALIDAEQRSQRSGRAELVTPDAAQFSAGRFVIVQASQSAAVAVQIDLARMVPRSEWIDHLGAPPQPLRMALQVDGGPAWALPMNDGQRVSDQQTTAQGGWAFDFRKHLAAASQPFELVVMWQSGWAAWPWLALLIWTLASITAVLGGWRLRRNWLAQAEQRRRAEEQLRFGQVARLNALGELAAGMAHELNQPLTAVLASTQAATRLLAEDPPELDTAQLAMQRAVAQARRASEVLQRLRRVVQPSGPDDDAGPLRLADAVRRALDLLADELARQQVTPQLALPATLQVAADPVALEQILHNLLSNALHALAQVPAPQRSLALQATHSGASVELRITDHGPGVPAALQPHLFEPFVTTRDGGLGLGLSLCETLAASMGARLHFEPAQPRGAVFVLSLPAASDTDTGTDPVSPQAR